MVETPSIVLNKPFFKRPKTYFNELCKKHGNAAAKDSEGNTLAHLSITYSCPEYLLQVPHLLDIKNKEGISARDLGVHLGLLPPQHKVEEIKRLYVYKTKTSEFAYLTEKELEEHFQISYLNHLEFQSAEYLAWALQKCKKKLLDPELRRKNLWIDSLYGTQFLQKKHPKVYVKWIDALVGYGLFAGEDIPPYSFIGEYTGVVRKRKNSLDISNNYIFGYVAGNSETPFVIDAQKKGNYTRFINHSDHPNLYSTWLIAQGLCHVILVSHNAIPKDSQLFYDYGPLYWKKRTPPFEM